MKIYVAQFFGDIEEQPPIVGATLEECLISIQQEYGYGSVHKAEDEDDWDYINGPDVEDDKIEIWEYDVETKKAKIVWGFWGWHWTMPDNMEQGCMPGSNNPLHNLMMEGY